jgi:RNA polymerase sigma-70 factor, ECF subfamily
MDLVLFESSAAIPETPFAFQGSERKSGRSASTREMPSKVLRGTVAQGSGETELLSRAKAGDDRAFMELCNKCSCMLKHKIFRIVGNPEDVKDVFQETLLRAYANVQRFRGTCSFQTWIMRIAINNALMLLRKRRVRAEKRFDFPNLETNTTQNWEVPDLSPDPEQLYLQMQIRKMLTKAVGDLPASFRSVVERYHGEGMSLADAADALGITESNAKSRLSRARAVLRRRLKSRSTRYI